MAAVFADASSIILLEKAHLFTLMLSTYTLAVPPSVFKEITAVDTADAARFSLQVALKRLHVMALPASHCEVDTFGLDKLDPGERDTICLYLTKKQGFILTDDGQAARLCRNRNLPFINALLVPKVLMYAGLVDKHTCKKAMTHLCELGWYAEAVKAFAFDCTQKQLTPFLPG
jgi:predicted nucleic acid-binding protein